MPTSSLLSGLGAGEHDALVLPAEIAEAQLVAYNAQDLERFCSFYAEDLVVAELNGVVQLTGRAAFQEKYARMFRESPANRVELLGRITLGDVVIDHERVFRTPDAAPFEVAAIYTFKGQKIVRVDFVKA
jgi:hypothetical protein